MQKQLSLNRDTPITLDEVMGAWSRGYESAWLSRREIADQLNRPKSPGLIQTLGILLGMGYLETRLQPLPNRVDMFQYRPTSKFADNGYVVKF